MTENPYASPPEMSTDGADGKKRLPKSKVAKLAWILPLLLIVLSPVFSLLPTRNFPGRSEELLFVLPFVCFAAGIVFTIYDLLHMKRFSNTYRNAIGGCVVYAVLGALIIVVSLMPGPTYESTTLPVNNGTTLP